MNEKQLRTRIHYRTYLGFPNTSSTFVYSSKILMTAPADLDSVKFSRKYRLFRKDLLEALEQKAWGIQVILKDETPAKLKQAIRNFLNAGYKWEDTVKLRSLHGTKLKTHTTIQEDGLSCTIDVYFLREEASKFDR